MPLLCSTLMYTLFFFLYLLLSFRPWTTASFSSSSVPSFFHSFPTITDDYLRNYPLSPSSSFSSSSSRSLLTDDPLPSRYCQPSNSSCWPTVNDWIFFNTSLNGRLHALLPPGYPCFIDRNSTACASVYANFIDPVWRSSIPGAMQFPQWEGDSQGNDCNDILRPCSQGNIPLYGVDIASPNDIVTTLTFARNRNIRVIVKTSGYDYLGRSTAPDAILVWLRNYKGITIDPAIPSVTVNSGETWESVYNAVYPTYTIVGGSTNTVGASGGYVVGGGYSFASPAYGLASDNVLRFTAVLANGTIVTVSDSSYPDLFWALRGGGSGFAIITSTTYRIYPSPSVGVTGVATVLQLVNGLSSLQIWLNAYLPLVSDLDKTLGNGAGVVAGGSVYVLPMQSLFAINFVVNGSKTQAQAYMLPLVNLANSLSNDITVVVNDYNEYPNMNEWWWKHDANGTTGTKTFVGSRFLPYTLCGNATALPTAVNKLSTVLWNTSGALIRVLGGSVRTNDIGAGTDFGNYNLDLTKTAISPYFRDAYFHILLGAQCPIEANLTVQNYTRDLVGGWIRELEDAIPQSSSYWGEAEYTDRYYEYNIWGAARNGSNSNGDSNDTCTNTSFPVPTTLYGKLQQIKQIYDPNGYLTCYHCVQLPSVNPNNQNNSCTNHSNTGNTTATPSPSPTPTPTPTSSPLNASAVPTVSPTPTATLSAGATPSNTPSNVPLQPSVSPSATASIGTRSIRDATFVLWDVPVTVYALPATLNVLVLALQSALANMVNINGNSGNSNSNYTRFQQAVTVSLTRIQDIASTKVIFSSLGYSGNGTVNNGGGNHNTTNVTRFLAIDSIQGTNAAGSEGVLIQYTVLINSANVTTYYSSLRNIAYLYTRSTDYVSSITNALRTEASNTGIPEIANGFNGVEVTPTRNRSGGDGNGSGGGSAGTAVGVTFLILFIIGIVYYRRRKAKAAAALANIATHDNSSRRQRVHRSVSAKMMATGGTASASFRQPIPAYAYEMANTPTNNNTTMMGTAPPFDTSTTTDWRIHNKPMTTASTVPPGMTTMMTTTPGMSTMSTAPSMGSSYYPSPYPMTSMNNNGPTMVPPPPMPHTYTTMNPYATNV